LACRNTYYNERPAPDEDISADERRISAEAVSPERFGKDGGRSRSIVIFSTQEPACCGLKTQHLKVRARDGFNRRDATMGSRDDRSSQLHASSRNTALW
jgi:hypothetical protein